MPIVHALSPVAAVLPGHTQAYYVAVAIIIPILLLGLLLQSRSSELAWQWSRPIRAFLFLFWIVFAVAGEASALDTLATGRSSGGELKILAQDLVLLAYVVVVGPFWSVLCAWDAERLAENKPDLRLGWIWTLNILTIVAIVALFF
jgi:hypothetical protein